MPVMNGTKIKPQRESGEHRAIREELEAALERLGEGPVAIAQQRARLVALFTQPGELSDDETSELSDLIKAHRARKRAANQYARRSARADAKWEAKAGTPWALDWEAKALDEAKASEAAPSTGKQAHHLFVIMGGKKAQRKAERRRERDRVKHAASLAAEELTRAAAKAAVGATTAGGGAPRAVAAGGGAFELDETADTAPRHRRLRAGVAYQTDAFGRVIDNDDE